MGYTHYWRGNESVIDQSAWPAAIADCDTLIAAAKDDLRLTITDAAGMIYINGDPSKDEDHEPFCIPRDGAKMQAAEFEFCKTARKPYDDVVTACLARLAEAGLMVSSDGTAKEWAGGLAFGEKVLGLRLAYPVRGGLINAAI